MAVTESRNLTILLTDIKGFTDKTSHKTRADILAMLERHNKIVLPVLQGKGGKLVKTIGDAFLMVYESPTDAVLAGIAVQDALGEHNKDKPEADRIEVRVAINSGEVALAEGDVFGEPVNIASRIEAIAEAGEVFFTEAVYLAMNKNEVPTSEVGLVQLKGIPEKIKVYKVRRETPVEGVDAASTGGWRGVAAGPKASTQPPPPSPVPTPDASQPSRGRRTGAMALDILIVALLVNAIVQPEVQSVPVQNDASKAKAAARNPDPPPAERVRAAPQPPPGASSMPIKKGTEVLLDEGEREVSTIKEQRDRAFPVFWFLYSFFFLLFKNATPGAMLVGLRVETLDASNLRWTHALARALFSVVSGYALMLGYITAVFRKDRRGWHDLVARTRVVRS